MNPNAVPHNYRMSTTHVNAQGRLCKANTFLQTVYDITHYPYQKQAEKAAKYFLVLGGVFAAIAYHTPAAPQFTPPENVHARQTIKVYRPK